MTSPADTYRAARADLADALLPLDDAALAVPVPGSDAAVHHLDALLAIGAADRPAVLSSAAFATRLASKAVDARVREAGLPALRIIGDGSERIAGVGEPVTTLAAPTIELSRALTGRRSEAQLRGLDWTGDPNPYLPLLAALPTAAGDVVEAAAG